MNFSDYCRPFYDKAHNNNGLKGISSQADIAAFFLKNALGAKAFEYLTVEDGTLSAYFTGKRAVPKETWAAVSANFNPDSFATALADKINDNCLADIGNACGIYPGKEIRLQKDLFTETLTEQFAALAANNGNCANIIATIYKAGMKPLDCPDYIANAYEKFHKIKTLLYQTEPQPFYDFFVCNTISPFRPRSNRIKLNRSKLISNATLEKLADNAQCSLLVGMGGIGKSMMMRHLFLDSLQKIKNTNKLPVIVILREYNTSYSSLTDLIIKSICRFDKSFDDAKVRKLLTYGRCQLLFDGLDEIKSNDMESFLRQLELFIDQYPQNQIVMSTRRFSSFIALSRFTILYMMPFSLEQSVELIQKLKYGDSEEEQKNKEEFIEKLKDGLYKEHYGFASNPLLLTLMLIHNRRFSGVPEKPYDFYHEAYETLLQLHDGNKLTMRRDFHSVRNPSDFTRVFREFCARSYRKADYEFDDQTFEKYFDSLHSKEKLDLSLMTSENFLFDVLHSACLMYEEGGKYHFLHRSFQEYFFADYYSRQDDSTLLKLGRSLQSSEQSEYDDSEGFNMLYDLAQEKVEHFIFLPFLAQIFEKNNPDEFLVFMEQFFSGVSYVVPNLPFLKIIDKNITCNEWQEENYTDFIITESILKNIGLEPFFKLDLTGDEPISYPLFRRGELFATEKSNPRTFIYLPEGAIETFKEARNFDTFFVADSNNQPLRLGYIYSIGFKMLIERPETFSALRSIIEKDDGMPKNMYTKVKAYYHHLRDKYTEKNDPDDDDF